MELPTLPKAFTTEARNRVVAASIRATREIQTSNAPSHPRMMQNFIMAVVGAFAIEACHLGEQGEWGSDEIDRQVREFLRQIAIRTESKYSSHGSITRNGHLIEQFEQYCERADEWRKYQDSLLAIADKATRHTGTNPTQSLSEQMDLAAVNLGISHEQLARRIGIGRTTYYAVKNGKGKAVTRIAVQQFVQKTNKSEQT